MRRVEGAVKSFKGEELAPLQGQRGTRAFTGTSELKHWFAPLSSAFLQHFQNEASAPQRRRSGVKWWGRRAWWGWRQGMTWGQRGSNFIQWPWGRRRAWAWTCPCQGSFSALPSAASDGPAPASCAPHESFSAPPQYATAPQPVWPEHLRSCGYSPPGFFPAPPAYIFLPPRRVTRCYVSAWRGYNQQSLYLHTLHSCPLIVTSTHAHTHAYNHTPN